MANTNIYRWQIAFLLGLGTLIFASALVFGVSSFTALVSVFAIAAAALNLVVAARTQDDSTNNWLRSQATRFLNVGPFLKTTTMVIWLLSVAIGGLGLFQAYRAYQDSKKITIEGLVLNARGDPADKAIVTLYLSKEKLQLVSDHGKFAFTNVNLDTEPSKNLKIQARLGTSKHELILDLTAGPPKGLVIQLPPGESPFRVTYFVLRQHAMDYLLQGKVDKDWEEKLAGQPYIVPNDVYNALSNLVNAFSISPLGEDVSFSEDDAGKKTTKEKSGDAQKYNIQKVFVGGAEGGEVGLSDKEVLPKYIASLSNPDANWKLFVDPNIDEFPDSLVFRRSANRSDLDHISYPDRMREFYSHVAREYMPPDFGYVELHLTSMGCGEDLGTRIAATRFIGRELSLRIAVVENITSETIEITNFSLKQNNVERLRRRDSDAEYYRTAQLKQENLFPLKSLKPNERVLIPLEMTFDFPKDRISHLTDKILPSRTPSLVERLQSVAYLKFPIYHSNSNRINDVYVNSSDIQNLVASTTSATSFDSKYVYGPSINIEDVEIDGVVYPFRQFDPNRIVIYQTAAMGSCPFVYTYSTTANAWLNEGVILYNRIGQAGKATDHKELSEFSGRIMIKENEPEVSFIDSVSITMIESNGRESTLYPQKPTLRYDDGAYVRLRRGERVIVHFQLPKFVTGARFVLNASGYYLPDR